MSIPLKDPSKGAIVLGTTQRQHMIAIGHIPPGTGPFEAHLANELVGRLNPSTAQRIPRTALRAIIDAGLIVFQVPDQLIDRRRGLHRGRPRALQPQMTPATSPANSRAMVASTHSKACSGWSL